jgi:hypothetical protein
MKKHNPQTPIMMREAAGTQPRVFARYGMTEHLYAYCVGFRDMDQTNMFSLDSFRQGEARSIGR